MSSYLRVLKAYFSYFSSYLEMFSQVTNLRTLIL